MVFLTWSWMFLRSNRLEQLDFKLEKIIGIKKHAGKVRKMHYCYLLLLLFHYLSRWYFSSLCLPYKIDLQKEKVELATESSFFYDNLLFAATN